MIAVFSADRAWRTRIETALRAHGVAVRTASRPAELAKCLSDGAVRAVVVGTADDDERQAVKVVSTLPLLRTSPGEQTEAVVRRAIEMA